MSSKASLTSLKIVANQHCRLHNPSPESIDATVHFIRADALRTHHALLELLQLLLVACRTFNNLPKVIKTALRVLGNLNCWFDSLNEPGLVPELCALLLQHVPNPTIQHSASDSFNYICSRCPGLLSSEEVFSNLLRIFKELMTNYGHVLEEEAACAIVQGITRIIQKMPADDVAKEDGPLWCLTQGMVSGLHQALAAASSVSETENLPGKHMLKPLYQVQRLRI